MSKAAQAQSISSINAPQEKGEIAVLSQPRLPYHPAVQDRFNIDRAGWKALVEAIFPAAKSADSVIMALSYCRARNLDPFKRPVHIVPMWDSAKGGYVETVWPGIAELRTTAFRTGQYAGCEETEWGPEVEQEFTGRIKQKGEWTEARITVRFPEWARITVYRELNGRVCKFVGPKVEWLESYATIGASDVPNDMWQSRPAGQLEKCAEAAALRKAFPEEIGNQLTAEEMAGQRLIEASVDAAPAASPKPPAPTPPKPITAQAKPQTETPHEPVTGEVLDRPAPATAPDGAPDPESDPEGFRQWADATLAAVSDPESLEGAFNDMIAPFQPQVFPPDWDDILGIYKKHEARLGID